MSMEYTAADTADGSIVLRGTGQEILDAIADGEAETTGDLIMLPGTLTEEQARVKTLEYRIQIADTVTPRTEERT